MKSLPRAFFSLFTRQEGSFSFSLNSTRSSRVIAGLFLVLGLLPAWSQAYALGPKLYVHRTGPTFPQTFDSSTGTATIVLAGGSYVDGHYRVHWEEAGNPGNLGNHDFYVANGAISSGGTFTLNSILFGDGRGQVTYNFTLTVDHDFPVNRPAGGQYGWIDGGPSPNYDTPGDVASDHPQSLTVVIDPSAPDENQTKECDLKSGCSDCSKGMASYSMHLMLASLHIEDTPISYNSPRGLAADFRVTYNQREANQPSTLDYSNLGPKWTFNWLSYVMDDGTAVATNPTVYVRGGGTESYTGFDSSTQSYAPDRQTLATLVRINSTTYEKRFPNGAKEVFSQSGGWSSGRRRIFLTSVVDAANNSTTLTYDGLRLLEIKDSLNPPTILTYDGLTGDPLKISRVTDPFGRFAKFEYTAGKLTKITDPMEIESRFEYEDNSDFINKMITPYGETMFRRGEHGNALRWLEVTDPRGGKERVEYNGSAQNIPSVEESAPPGVYNNGLEFQNTFYWDRKAMADAPNDHSKARVIHWLVTPEGKMSGIKHSEKKALENRVWYTYPGQTDLSKVGNLASPSKIMRFVSGGGLQRSQYTYNPLGNVWTETDPLDRVKRYAYATNNIDVETVYQHNPSGVSVDPFDGAHADKIASNTYNTLHEPLVSRDAAGEPTTNTYNTFGQIFTRKNAKEEITTYEYGDNSPGKPVGYLTSITSPQFPQVNGSSAITYFTYDLFHRVNTSGPGRTTTRLPPITTTSIARPG